MVVAKPFPLVQRLRPRRGFTILEMILALGLTVLVMYAISSAIFVHLRMLDARRTNVDEAQLARAVLRMIADDLRRAIHFRKVDLSATEDMIAETLGAADGGDLSAEDGAATPPEPIDPSQPTENTEDLAGSETAPLSPGVYGNMYEMMIDISRLPRDDEYPSMLSPDAVLTDLPSDIKTVTYYIGPDPQVANNMAAASLGQTAKIGLIRRELDRSVNRLAVAGGLSMDLLAGASQLVAPEVVAVEFAYYDGYQMLPQWDSTLMEGLPVAVEIRLTIASRAPAGDEPGGNLNDPIAGQVINGEVVDEGLTYRLLVPLPTAEPYQPPEEEVDPETGEPIQP